MKSFASLVVVISIASGAATAASLPANFSGHQLAAGAKITLAQASGIALKARPGHIVDQELEKEGGGSGLRYSFDVATGNETIEVGVDAVTGRVLENGAESNTKESAEAARERVPTKR